MQANYGTLTIRTVKLDLCVNICFSFEVISISFVLFIAKRHGYKFVAERRTVLEMYSILKFTMHFYFRIAFIEYLTSFSNYFKKALI